MPDQQSQQPKAALPALSTTPWATGIMNSVDQAHEAIHSAQAILQRMLDQRMTIDRDYVYSPEDGPVLRGVITILQAAEMALAATTPTSGAPPQ